MLNRSIRHRRSRAEGGGPFGFRRFPLRSGRRVGLPYPRRQPSERVQIKAVTPKKNSARIDIVFLDDPNQRAENIPASRLRVLWDQVSSYDELMANWQHVDDLALDDVEQR